MTARKEGDLMNRLAALMLVFSTSVTALAAEEYRLGPDSERHPGVAPGTVARYTWTSKIFSGTVRDAWVYVPALYKPD